MAFAKYDAIYTRARELLEGGHGTYRAIDASRFSGGLHDGLPAETLARLGELSQKPCEVLITPTKHPQRLTIVGNVQIEGFTMEVRVVRALATPTQVDDSLRDAVKALAAIDASVITQAFEWPGNWTTTQAGATTDCKAVMYDGPSPPRVRVNKLGAAMIIDTIHKFSGTCLSRPATS